MKYEEHCKDSVKKLGFDIPQIHEYLDEFAKLFIESSRYKHRQFRHHLEGLIEIENKFGGKGLLVATNHIIVDNEGMIPIKKDYEIIEYELNRHDLQTFYCSKTIRLLKISNR